MGYNYHEELATVQRLKTTIEKLIYELETAKTELLYEPAICAVKHLYKETSGEMLAFYNTLTDCEANIKLDLLFWGSENND